jgi:hypothetical protein
VEFPIHFIFAIALFSNLLGVVSGDMGGSVKEGACWNWNGKQGECPEATHKIRIRNGGRCGLVTK